jgi:hypothetical protein
MTDDKRVQEALRAALQGPTPQGPSRDLWPLILARGGAPAGWSWVDLVVAAATLILLLIRPEWLWLLVFHL